jgi:hypothetical protein
MLGCGHDSILPFTGGVFLMRDHCTNVYKLKIVPNARNQSIFIAADVENGQGIIVGSMNAIGVRVIAPDILEAFPFCMSGRLIPLPQRPFRIGIPLPELPQRLQTDYAHLDIMSQCGMFVKFTKLDA